MELEIIHLNRDSGPLFCGEITPSPRFQPEWMVEGRLDELTAKQPNYCPACVAAYKAEHAAIVVKRAA